MWTLKKVERNISTSTLQGNFKKLWNMKVTIISIVICVLGTVTKGLIQGLEELEITGRVETIQTTALLRSARLLRRVLETWENLLVSNSRERPSTLADGKISQGVIIIIIIIIISVFLDAYER